MMMSEIFDAATKAAAKPSVRAERFDRTSMTLHWLTVFLVSGQFASAWLHDAVGHDAMGHHGHEAHDSVGAAVILTVHRSMGVLTWIVTGARLVWWRNFARLPPFPANMPKLQQWAAMATEYALYALLLVQPLTGLANALFRGRSFALFMWSVPPLMEPDKVVADMFHAAHEFGATALLGLIGVHAAAALFHGLILRDGVLQRMLPWTSR